MWIFALADDLTGALETGAKFAARGLSVKVTTGRDLAAQPDVEVLVIDTETRHLGADSASTVVRELGLAARAFGPGLVYKKTDSTLRGNIGAELGALRDAFPDREIVFAPAYPELGRTVRGGSLFVHGEPVHRTAFARDPLNPIQSSDVCAVLGGVSAMVFDGETPADVESAARAIWQGDPRPLAAGPAALAAALARLVRAECGVPDWPRVRRPLVVNGSLHPASLAQFSQGRGAGWDCFECEVEGVGLERAHGLADRVAWHVRECGHDALVVFGGDTAFAIHRALGGEVFEPIGEILPGVPVSRCGGLLWITKAGGFGESDLLARIRDMIDAA
jgi:uncharacterized protein YgbK (DUF1537 family)